ncbi:hypothetical protein FJ364_01735, partial [Candidatus Dependentiae bacterium]|nr:hypothetical protein [Candidatus Dependentiae bacterium]
MLKKILLILFVVAACGFYLLFIRPAQLPRPASSSYREISFKVGRIDYFLEDRSRVDPHQQALHEFRIVPVSFYYPVSCGEKKLPSPLPYSPQMIEKVKSVAEKHFRMPRILLRPLDKLKTHSYKDAPLSRSDEQYPLIIFEHGLGSTPDFYTNLIEHLVARGGFIVAAISHAYASRNVILPDGKILKSALWWDGMRYPRKAVMREIEQQLWMEDVLFLLDQLFTKKLQSPVITAIDVERIGIIGHSFGGSTAAQLCRLDNRIKAGVNMDGGLNGPDFLEPF